MTIWRTIPISVVATVSWSGAGINYLVETVTGDLYVFFVDSLLSDVFYRKSTDGGVGWSGPVRIRLGTNQALAIWYDRWSGISGDLIHITYTDSSSDSIFYRNLDTTDDSLATETTVFAGSTAISGGALTITRGRNGDLRVAGSIDAGTEDGAWSSTDVGATWGDTIADPSEGETQDQYLLLPGWNADTADVMLIFWDASSNELSVKRYDDSLNSWSETSIATSMIDEPAVNDFPHFAASVDLTNSRNIIVAWSDVDTANADLRCWIITDTAITETGANVVLNSTDDQGLCSISIDGDTGTWYVFYAGKSDGSETYSSTVKIYYKVSIDDGANWSTERNIGDFDIGANWLMSTPRITFFDFPRVGFADDGTIQTLYIIAPVSLPRVHYQIGIG